MTIIQILCISRTRLENRIMPTSFVYHALGLRDQFYKRTLFLRGAVIIEVFPKPEAIRCPECHSRSVKKKRNNPAGYPYNSNRFKACPSSYNYPENMVSCLPICTLN